MVRNFNKLKLIIFIAILVILVLGFFYKIVFFDKIFITGDLTGCDILDLGYPFKYFLSQSLDKKNLPIWCSELGCGFPIHADGKGGFFYPINLLLFFLFSPLTAFNWCFVIAFLIAGISTYLYACNLRLTTPAALFSSIVFTFSSFFIGHIRQIHIISIACWLPLLFLIVKLLFDTGKLYYSVLLGCILGFQILCGYPQVFYYSALATGLYFLYYFFVTKKRFRFFLLSIFISIFVMLGIGAVQWLPSYEMFKLSSYINLIKIQWYHFKDIITLFLPHFYGKPPYFYGDGGLTSTNFIPWENCIYVGLLPLILTIAGIIICQFRNRQVNFFASLLIFTFILLLIKPVFNILGYILPGFAVFRFPHRLSLIIVFCFAILAGYGIDSLRKFAWIKKYSFFIITLLLITIFDLFKFGLAQHYTIDYDLWTAQPQTVKFLKDKKEKYRIWPFRTDYSWIATNVIGIITKNHPGLFLKHKELLQSNINLFWNIPSASVYNGLILERYSEMTEFINKEISLVPAFPGAKADMSGKAIKILGLLNVKYILSMWTLNNDSLTTELELPFIQNFDKLKVYKNKFALPRVFLVPKARFIDNEKHILQIMSEYEFNPQQEIIIEKDICHGSSGIDGSRAKIVKYSDREVIIESNFTNSGFLVLNDTYYPGWKVFVNGEEKEIIQANYLMRAVALSKGSHTVRFYYDPIYFKIGSVISLLTSLMVVFLILLQIYKMKHNKFINLIILSCFVGWFFIACWQLVPHIKLVYEKVVNTYGISSEEIRERLYGDFYKFMQRCRKEIPENSTAFLITNSLFNYYYATYYLYPRRILMNSQDEPVYGFRTKNITVNLSSEFLEKNNISYIIYYEKFEISKVR